MLDQTLAEKKLVLTRNKEVDLLMTALVDQIDSLIANRTVSERAHQQAALLHQIHICIHNAEEPHL